MNKRFSTPDVWCGAVASVFLFVQPGKASGGDFEAVTSGAYELRVDRGSGELELEQPALAGDGRRMSVRFAAPQIKLRGEWQRVSAVRNARRTSAGLELVQSVGSATVVSRAAFVTDGVIEYEISDVAKVGGEATQISFGSNASEHFYGFGEKFNALDQSGKLVKMQTFDEPGEKGDRSYKSVPWLMSSRGFGVHLVSTGESTWDLRNSKPDRVVVTNPLPVLKYQFVGGPLLADVLQRFSGIVGRPPVPPAWVFGTWISSDIWRTGGEVRYVVEKYAQEKIPASVFVFDSPWETSYNDFQWNMTQFGLAGTYEGKTYEGFRSVGEMMEFFRAHGLKVVLWMTPFANVSSIDEKVPGLNRGQAGNYAEGAAKNYFVRDAPGSGPLVVRWWKGWGSPVDFTNPAAANWMQSQLKVLVDQSMVRTASGAMEPVIGGFKTDDGEMGNAKNTYIPEAASYFDGRSGKEMRNGYCVGYHEAVWNVLGTSGTLFARSGFSGTQKFPFGWAGDNAPNFSQENGLRSVMTAGLSAAMSGFSMWAHDVGGYEDSKYEKDPEELFIRWSQFGALSPVMQMHRQVGTGRQYAWSYGARGLENYRACARLHSQLFPYIYKCAERASRTGLPILQPLVLKHQDDARLAAVQDEYYFGDDLLVAPIADAGATSRTVVLPPGRWVDWWTREKADGGRDVVWSGDVTRFPLYVRDGARVPMLRDVPMSLCGEDYVGGAMGEGK